MNHEGLQFWGGNINRMINKDRDRDRQNKLLPLKIRQSVIAHLIKENNDIRVVQEFAGHRRTASTESYKQSGLEELKISDRKTTSATVSFKDANCDLKEYLFNM